MLFAALLTAIVATVSALFSVGKIFKLKEVNITK